MQRDENKVYECKSQDSTCQYRRATDLTREEFRELVRQSQIDGMERWADKQFLRFGKWTAVGLAAAVFALMVRALVKAGLI